MNPHYATVAARAAHRCEYCRAPEVVFNLPFEVEHILPLSRGGSDDAANWALACRACNLRKWAHTTGYDPLTQEDVPLFHPRNQTWDEHFSLDRGTGSIDGRTAIGRATVLRLEMNATAQLTARRLWIRLALLP